MNFQTVSTAEKLPTSDGLTGRLPRRRRHAGPAARRARSTTSTRRSARWSRRSSAHGLAGSTVIVLSAKHGQSPHNPSALTRIPDGPIIDGAQRRLDGGAPRRGRPRRVRDRRRRDAASGFTIARRPRRRSPRTYLLGHSGVGNDINGNPKPYTSSGLAQAFAGADAAAYFGVPPATTRVPRTCSARSARRRLHGQAGQDRRARRRRPAGSRRPARGQRRAADARPLAPRRRVARGDDADRADHPAAPRARPRRPAGRADPEHAEPAAGLRRGLHTLGVSAHSGSDPHGRGQTRTVGV